ncbi:MAG: NADH pyrophosphatase [Chlamydiia bacterium]|nr:NADH pyrophosphatase [Chlamydiia bacterium]
MGSNISNANQIQLQSPTLKPKVGVAVLVVKDGKVLLGKRKNSHGSGLWATPGGHLEFAETIEECAKRELLEETGLIAHTIKVGPWTENISCTKADKHYITFFVIAESYEGDVALLEPHKCEGWEWFPIDDLPSPLFPSIISILEKAGNSLTEVLE